LVAKEFCAASLEGRGVLILSESAGAGAQLQDHVLLVNPQDVEGVAASIHRAVTMPPEERRRRMEALRKSIRKQDIFWWTETFLKAAADEDLGADDDVEMWRPAAPPGFFEAASSRSPALATRVR
jgi:trehalose 6-phosphate synthase